MIINHDFYYRAYFLWVIFRSSTTVKL